MKIFVLLFSLNRINRIIKIGKLNTKTEREQRLTIFWLTFDMKVKLEKTNRKLIKCVGMCEKREDTQIRAKGNTAFLCWRPSLTILYTLYNHGKLFLTKMASMTMLMPICDELYEFFFRLTRFLNVKVVPGHQIIKLNVNTNNLQGWSNLCTCIYIY